MFRLLGLIVVTTFLVVAPNAVQAQQPLVTGELPASLRAAGVRPDQILTAKDARSVRGGQFPSQGVAITLIGGSTYVPNTATLFRASGGGESVLVGFNQGNLFFATQGTALIGDYSQVRGIVVSQSPLYNGFVAFQGNPTNVQIVAYPQLMSIQIR